MPETVKVAAWEWTVEPTWPIPTEEQLIRLVNTKGLAYVHELHQQRERGVALRQLDPLHHGWEAPPFRVARDLMRGTYRLGSIGTPTGARPAGDLIGPADDLNLMFANRAGKSHFGGRYVNEVMINTPEARVRCWSETLDMSRSIQQASVFRCLPPALRRVKRQGQFTKISYSAGTGFTEETFLFSQPQVGPMAYAQCWFMTYSAWANAPNIAEGWQAHLIWLDEEFSAELVETLRFRKGSAPLQMLITFTPKSGYTPAVAQYVQGARVLETVPARRVVYDFWRGTWSWGEWILPPDKVLAEGCPPGHVPFLLEHTQVKGRYTLCAGTAWNPYVNLDEILKAGEGLPLESKLIRWFGWPTRMERPALQFQDAHLVPAENIPPLSEMTIYQCVDPCPPPRNWFLLWVGIDREDRMWVLAEWPDHRLGEWAVPGTEPDGKPGPAQHAPAHSGGFDAYKLLILEMEGWRPGDDGVWRPGPHAVRIMQRLFDPRAAAWKVPSLNVTLPLTYLDAMLEPVRRTVAPGRTVDIAPGLEFDAAPAEDIEKGNELINGRLTRGWDAAAPLSAMNCPQFYINAGPKGDPAAVHPFLREGCHNTIWSLRTFTGRKRSGAADEKSACKDPIDCLKAACKADLKHLPPGALGTYPRGRN